MVCSAIGSIVKIGSRAAKLGQGLLGADFAGGVITDRYVGHDWSGRSSVNCAGPISTVTLRH